MLGPMYASEGGELEAVGHWGTHAVHSGADAADVSNAISAAWDQGLEKQMERKREEAANNTEVYTLSIGDTDGMSVQCHLVTLGGEEKTSFDFASGDDGDAFWRKLLDALGKPEKFSHRHTSKELIKLVSAADGSEYTEGKVMEDLNEALAYKKVAAPMVERDDDKVG